MTIFDTCFRSSSLCLLAIALIIAPSRAQNPKAAAAEAPQILWQRTLDDALALAKTENRPLLVAVNVDGESASDRIVVERYRDPRFVRWTQSFVCVVASVSRHNARDYDERGRRIPCPRLGEITCGEHIALEPVLYEKYLGGDRISPRHALIQPNGEKTFDLFLLFDLRELDKALEEAAGKAPAPLAPAQLPRAATELAAKDANRRAAQWRELAAARDNRGRTSLERILASLGAESGSFEALSAIDERGDAGSAGALRLLLGRDPPPSGDLLRRVADTATRLKIGSELARIVRERLGLAGSTPGACGLGADAALLPLLARFDAKSPATRSLLLAYQALGGANDRRVAGDALAPALGVDDVSRVAATIEKEGGPVELAELLAFSVQVGRTLPPRSKPKDELVNDEAIESELVEADRILAASPGDVVAMHRFALASLNRARRMIDAAKGDARLNLEDARTWLARVSEKQPGDLQVGLERARVAYYLGRFEEQEQVAVEAFGAWPRGDAFPSAAAAVVDTARVAEGDVRRAALLLDDDLRIEALRWLGDGAARMLAVRTGGDAALEVGGFVRGARALALVVANPGADETDWVSLASFLGAIGLFREELAAWQAGAVRLPESKTLRDGLVRALWNVGRIDLAPVKADWIAALHPQSAACAWYAGYGWMLAAEDLRRQEKPDPAIQAYAEARARFDSCAKLDPSLDRSAKHFSGMSALGIGFAHLIVGRREPAADALVEGLATCPTVGDARDGLDREVVDLVDGVLEWREGQKSAVDAVVLAQRLAGAEPDNPRWALAVADSELREALRADGRSTRTREASSGPPERMPTEEGDAYMRRSIAAARIALGITANDETKRRLAQSLTVQAERNLKRDSLEPARSSLTEAAKLLGEDDSIAGAGVDALRALAERLRAKLGEARPVFRPGR